MLRLTNMYQFFRLIPMQIDDTYIGEYLLEYTLGVQNDGKSRVFREPVASLRAEQPVRKQSLVGQRFTELLTARACCLRSGARAAQARVRQLVRRGAARAGERSAARDCVRLCHAARDAVLDQQVLGVWLCLSRTQRCRSY